jgi:parallel beta-helix repeat protein
MVRFVLLIATAILILAEHVNSSPTYDSAKHIQPGQSIQAAIDKASHGDRIFVGPGTYAEQLTIKTDGISLIGKGAILTPPPTPTSNTCSGLAGNDTEAGICVTGSGVSLAPFATEHRKFISVDTPVSGVSITGFKIQGFTGLNIAVVGARDTRISHNQLVDGTEYGFLTVGSSNTVVERNTVSTSTSQLYFIAMCMDDTSPPHFTHNHLSGYYVGFCVQSKGAQVVKNSVKECCIGAFVDPGIDGAYLQYNHISALNPGCAGSPTGGIFVDGAVNTKILNNLIEGQVFNSTAGGIVVVDEPTTTPESVVSGTVIEHNILRNNDFDIFVNTTGTGNVVESNQCSTPKELCSS